MNKKKKLHEIEELLRGEQTNSDQLKRKYHFGTVNTSSVESMKEVLLPSDYFEVLQGLSEEEQDRQIAEWKEMERQRKERPSLKI